MSANTLQFAAGFLISVSYCIASACCGHVILRVSRPLHLACESAIRPLTAFALGLCALAVAWLALALPGWLAPLAVVSVLAAFCVPGIRPLWRDLIELHAGVKEHARWWQTQNRSFRIATALCLLLVVLLAIGALIKPPIGDAEAFYMAYATVIADSERLIPMPGLYSSFSQIGLLGELHFAALIQLGGVPAAKFLLWPVAVLGALMLARIGILAGLQQRGAWYTVVIVFTSTTFTHYITDGKVDLFAAALGLAACCWALMAKPGKGRHAALALSGLFAGFACVAKISYIAAFLPPLYFLVIWRHWHLAAAESRCILGTASALAQLTLWIFIAWVPHLLKNSLLFSAPFAPFFGAGDDGIITQTWFSPEITRRIIATYPFALVFGRYPMQGGNLSFLLLAFLPLALLLPRATPLLRSTLAQLATAALLGTVIWVLLRPSVIAPRYLLATLLLFAPLAARAAESVETRESRNGWLRLAIITTITVTLVIFIYPHRKLPGELVRLVLGNAPPCRLASPYCAPLMDLSHRAAPGDRVFFAAYYGYWLGPSLLQCRDSRPEQKLIEGAHGSPWANLAEQGFRFVVVDPVSHGAVLERLKGSRPPAWLAVHTLHEDASLVSYELSVGDPSFQPRTRCQQIAPPAWDVVRGQASDAR